LEAVKDPGYTKHIEMLDWFGLGFDPEEFDLNEINQKLENIVLS
jgi:hypothetical protein